MWLSAQHYQVRLGISVHNPLTPKPFQKERKVNYQSFNCNESPGCVYVLLALQSIHIFIVLCETNEYLLHKTRRWDGKNEWSASCEAVCLSGSASTYCRSYLSKALFLPCSTWTYFKATWSWPAAKQHDLQSRVQIRRETLHFLSLLIYFFCTWYITHSFRRKNITVPSHYPCHPRTPNTSSTSHTNSPPPQSLSLSLSVMATPSKVNAIFHVLYR